jgi:hypothetical protein
LNWYVTKVNGETLLTQKYIGTTGDHRHYILLAEPQSPMTVPWTDVLDYSCSWAVSRTSTTAAASAITNSLFNSGFKYDVDGGGGSHYSNGWTQFDLTSFTSDLGSSKLVNCLDMGKAVTTFSNAVGCGLGLCTYGWTTYGEYQIDGPLNCIDPIGTPSPTNNPFGYPIIDDDCRISGFSYHAFSEKISNFNVWDATLRYDIDTNPDNVSGSNPGCGFTTTGYSWKLPADEIESTYISRLIDSWPEFYYSTPTLRRNRSLSVY